ncbi:MAG: cation transporter [Bacteroidaceae bacterium]|nr:cation transporter [Bacteroidaceae bacterium]
MNRDRRIYNITLVGSLVNAALIVLKFAAGIIGNSAAMIADAIHSLSDFVTDIIVILFVHLSNKPADDDHCYGHGKYETIATSIIGITLLAVALKLGCDGCLKIIDFCNGKPLPSPGIIAFAAAVMSIILKEWIYIATRKVAREVNSKALEANAWHHRSDALSSVGTAIGIGGAVLLGSRWAVLDAVAALVVSVFIAQTAVKLIRQSAGELLEESLPKSTEKRILQIAGQDSMVSDIHNLRTRRIGNRIAIEMHLRLPGTITLEEAHNHASGIEAALRREFGANTHIMLHLEPVK